MNPHRLAWGFVRTLPLSETVAITTLVGMILTGRWKRPPLTLESVLLALFILWMQLTTLFAINQEGAWVQWEKVMKIQFMILITMMLIRSLEQVRALVWVIVISLGLFGVKGGVFTIVTGGEHRVWGPDGTFLDGNNEIGLALVMTIPLMRYLQLTTAHRLVRSGLWVAISLCVISVLGTHSRGAFLGIAVMLAFLVWKSRYRLRLIAVASVLLPIALALMPQKWFDRMNTLRNYKQDASAMARLNSWQFALNLALDRPVVGGGFETFQPELFAIYAPDPTHWADAHSIYFEVLGEHGFVGLMLYLTLGLCLWRSCSWIARRARDAPEVSEFEHLARMMQVSVAAFAVCGAFLGLAYFDLYYNILAIVVVSKALLASSLRERSGRQAFARSPVPAGVRKLHPTLDRA
jgi:probable O-glycosylation ligase (exosortase A-associated)